MERIMRDLRINTIIEGTSEIMRLIIAREALDRHVRTALDCLNPKLAPGLRLKKAVEAFRFYSLWYPRQWLPNLWSFGSPRDPVLARHMRFVRRSSRRLARSLFHAMVVYQQRLEKKQRLLFRFVDIGMELFAMAVACGRAQAMIQKDGSSRGPRDLADLFCREARERVEATFRKARVNSDRASYALGRRVLSGKFTWLEEGIVRVRERRTK